jgi:hypothetical protein
MSDSEVGCSGGLRPPNSSRGMRVSIDEKEQRRTFKALTLNVQRYLY